MKSYSFIFVFLLTACAVPTAEQSSLLWKISGNGLDKPSYLLGTFHGTYDILYNFTDSIPHFKTIFEEVEQYAGESNDYNKVKEMEVEELLAIFPQNAILLPPDTTYKDLLEPEELVLLDSTLMDLMEITSEQMIFSPSFLSMFIDHMQQEKILLNRNISIEEICEFQKEIMDLRLLEEAEKKGYEIHGLEEHLETMKELLSTHGLKRSAQQLIYSLQTETSALTSELVSAYRSQNMENILEYEEKLKQCMAGYEIENEFKEQQQNILDKRNLAWMDKIPQLIHYKPTLIGVGVRHLPGEAGLVNLLRNAGYQLEPIN